MMALLMIIVFLLMWEIRKLRLFSKPQLRRKKKHQIPINRNHSPQWRTIRLEMDKALIKRMMLRWMLDFRHIISKTHKRKWKHIGI